jgi:hypothetical protein
LRKSISPRSPQRINSQQVIPAASVARVDMKNLFRALFAAAAFLPVCVAAAVSDADVLAVIDQSLAHPTSSSAATVQQAMDAYHKQKPSALEPGRGAMDAFQLFELKSLPPDKAGILLTAYVAGALRDKLRPEKPQPHAALLAMVGAYTKLKSADPTLNAALLDPLVDVTSEDAVKTYVDGVEARAADAGFKKAFEVTKQPAGVRNRQVRISDFIDERIEVYCDLTPEDFTALLAARAYEKVADDGRQPIPKATLVSVPKEFARDVIYKWGDGEQTDCFIFVNAERTRIIAVWGRHFY